MQSEKQIASTNRNWMLFRLKGAIELIQSYKAKDKIEQQYADKAEAALVSLYKYLQINREF